MSLFSFNVLDIFGIVFQLQKGKSYIYYVLIYSCCKFNVHCTESDIEKLIPLIFSPEPCPTRKITAIASRRKK